MRLSTKDEHKLILDNIGVDFKHIIVISVSVSVICMLIAVFIISSFNYFKDNIFFDMLRLLGFIGLFIFSTDLLKNAFYNIKLLKKIRNNEYTVKDGIMKDLRILGVDKNYITHFITKIRPVNDDNFYEEIKPISNQEYEFVYDGEIIDHKEFLKENENQPCLLVNLNKDYSWIIPEFKED